MRNVILGAGGLATAIAAILGLVRALTPDDPPSRGAELGEVSVRGQEPISAFLNEGGERTSRASGPVEGTAPLLAAASVTLAQEALQDDPARTDPGQPLNPGGTGTSTGPEPPTTGTTTEPEPPLAEIVPEDYEAQPEEVKQIVNSNLTPGPVIQAVDLPEVDTAAQERRIEARATRTLTGNPGADESQVRAALAGTLVKWLPYSNAANRSGRARLLPASTPAVREIEASKRDRLVPFGRAVNVPLSFEGYKGSRLAVNWTLYNARRDVPVNRDWLQHHPALEVRPRAHKDSLEGVFWMPIPKAVKGPFVLQVELVDEDGTLVDRATSKRF